MDFYSLFSSNAWIVLITFLCIFVMYGYWTYGVFQKLGIPGPKPLIYIGTITRHKEVYYLADKECAQSYGRIWGMYEFRKPVLAVMDPEMLKIILVKECFTYFTNRRNFRLNGELYDAVSNAEDDQWRRIRNFLTPNFTSGRIKEMFSIMKHHSKKLTDRLQAKGGNNEIIAIRDFFGPYSLDVMMSSVFSVDMDLINSPTSPLIDHARKFFRISIPIFLLQACFPIFLPILELLGVSLFPKKSMDFIKTVVDKIIEERNGSPHQNSGDVLQHMINPKNVVDPGKEKHNKAVLASLNDHEIRSQAVTFVVAGSETSATTLGFLAYNLARNPEVMKRLQEEIEFTFPNKGSVEYEALMQMEYLDCVVNECLRLYPPAARLERTAKETVRVRGVTIPKGMIVMIPVYALHRDPELWPEPEEFKPDRFTKKNKQCINPYTYMPFGVGPRNCLGMRFALLLVKLALVEVLQSYSFSICEETEIPLQMDPQGLVGPLQPIKLKLVTRSKG